MSHIDIDRTRWAGKTREVSQRPSLGQTDGVLTLSGAQCRAARAILRWTSQELADRAGVNQLTVGTLEREVVTTQARNRDAIRMALEAGGVTFIKNGVRYDHD